jgi:hypothetical protein
LKSLRLKQELVLVYACRRQLMPSRRGRRSATSSGLLRRRFVQFKLFAQVAEQSFSMRTGD